MPCILQLRTELKQHPHGYLSDAGTDEVQRNRSYRGEVINALPAGFFADKTIGLEERRTIAHIKISNRNVDSPQIIALTAQDIGPDPERPLRHRAKRVRRQLLIDQKPADEQAIRDAYNPNTVQMPNAFVEFTWEQLNQCIVNRSIIETEEP